jgi:hypothetical protein
VGGKVKIKDVQDLAYTRRLDAQGIDRLVNAERFSELWKLLGDIDRGEGSELIGSGNLDKVKKWFEERKKEHPETMSVKELREMAGDLGVKYYYTLNKEKLIAAIRRKQNG